jgi:hypothetical protein
MSRYAYKGASSGELLTWRGRVLVHDNRHEMEFLCPNTPVVRITDGELGQPVMRLRDHPHLEHITWPLQRADFR